MNDNAMFLFTTGIFAYLIGTITDKKYPKFAVSCYLLSIPIQCTSMYFNITYILERKERIKALEKTLEIEYPHNVKQE